MPLHLPHKPIHFALLIIMIKVTYRAACEKEATHRANIMHQKKILMRFSCHQLDQIHSCNGMLVNLQFYYEAVSDIYHTFLPYVSESK